MDTEMISVQYRVGDLVCVKDLGKTEFEVTLLAFDVKSKKVSSTLKSRGTFPGKVTIFITEEHLSKVGIGNPPGGTVDRSAKRRKSERVHQPNGAIIESTVDSPNKLPTGQKSSKQKSGLGDMDLEFCWAVLKEMQLPKHSSFARHCYDRIDSVALDIPTYYAIIREPMDLTTVQTKLGNNAYHEINKFKADVQLIFKNCYKLNGEGEYVNYCGHALEKVFNKKWDTKHDWISVR
jgi:hypothetical protein